MAFEPLNPRVEYPYGSGGYPYGGGQLIGAINGINPTQPYPYGGMGLGMNPMAGNLSAPPMSNDRAPVQNCKLLRRFGRFLEEYVEGVCDELIEQRKAADVGVRCLALAGAVARANEIIRTQSDVNFLGGGLAEDCWRKILDKAASYLEPPDLEYARSSTSKLGAPAALQSAFQQLVGTMFATKASSRTQGDNARLDETRQTAIVSKSSFPAPTSPGESQVEKIVQRIEGVVAKQYSGDWTKVHPGEFRKALEVYKRLQKKPDPCLDLSKAIIGSHSVTSALISAINALGSEAQQSITIEKRDPNPKRHVFNWYLRCLLHKVQEWNLKTPLERTYGWLNTSGKTCESWTDSLNEKWFAFLGACQYRQALDNSSYDGKAIARSKNTISKRALDDLIYPNEMLITVSQPGGEVQWKTAADLQFNVEDSHDPPDSDYYDLYARKKKTY